MNDATVGSLCGIAALALVLGGVISFCVWKAAVDERWERGLKAFTGLVGVVYVVGRVVNALLA